MLKKIKLVFVVVFGAVFCGSLFAAPGGNGVVPKLNWADSYSADGRCYIDSNFDHGIANTVVSTPAGNQTVRQVAAKLGRGPGSSGNPVYNDVQCGNGPANNAGDEDYDQCPGRVDRGAAGCSVIGPKWDLAAAYGQAQPSAQPSSANDNANADNNADNSVECAAWGDTLASAKRAFAASCPTATQRDCDPLQGRTLCANVPVENLAVIPASQSAPAAAPAAAPPAPQVNTPTVAQPQPSTQQSGACYVIKSSIGVAKRAFAASCTSAGFRDCDPINGQWVCASVKVETLDQSLFNRNPLAIVDASAGGAADAPAPVVTSTPAPPVSTTVTAGNLCYASAGTLQGARQAFAGSCPGQPVDCDPVDSQWVCASQRVESIANLNLSTPVAAASPSTLTQAPVAAPVRSARNSVLDSGNLLSLHYDCAPDRDDGHANVAGRVLADVFNLRPHVVVGAYGYKLRGAYNAGCEPIFDAAWSSGTALSSGYLNAFVNRSGAVNSTASLWKRTLQNGGQVFVAEGGPSDFTYDVLLKLSDNERGGVTVVQHSQWNEDQTRSSSLNFVKNNTNYIRIADGNASNSTADLNQKSSSFVTRALNSRWQVAWSSAFAFLDPGQRLDFSDTVEILHLLDVPRALVATPNDFADRYFR